MSTNKQFDSLFAGDPNYLGCLYQQDTPQLKNGQFVVINNDDDIQAPPFGTHWTGLFRKGNTVYFMDSFGVLPPQGVAAVHPKTVYSTKQLQDISEDTCGEYVAAFLLWMKVGWSYASFLRAFDPSVFKFTNRPNT